MSKTQPVGSTLRRFLAGVSPNNTLAISHYPGYSATIGERDLDTPCRPRLPPRTKKPCTQARGLLSCGLVPNPRIVSDRQTRWRIVVVDLRQGKTIFRDFGCQFSISPMAQVLFVVYKVNARAIGTICFQTSYENKVRPIQTLRRR
jgi:hypothetical protein